MKSVEIIIRYYRKYCFQFLIASLIIAGLNFVVFLTLASTLGGDAWNGKIENERYFLGSHGKYTEVTHQIYVYSQIHVIGTIFISCLCVFYALLYCWNNTE